MSFNDLTQQSIIYQQLLSEQAGNKEKNSRRINTNCNICGRLTCCYLFYKAKSASCDREDFFKFRVLLILFKVVVNFFDVQQLIKNFICACTKEIASYLNVNKNLIFPLIKFKLKLEEGMGLYYISVRRNKGSVKDL